MKRIDAKELIGQKLTVRDLMFIMDDIDLYDDACDDLAIAFCNPFDDDEVHIWSEYLTQEGIEKFGEVLFYPAHIAKQIRNGYTVYNFIVEIDDEDDKVWKKRLRKAKEFFESAAGYCSCTDYDKWFRM